MLNSSVTRKIAQFAAAALFCGVAVAQTSAVAPRITQRVNDSQRTVLHGNTLPIAQAKYDQGAVPSGTPANRMLLVLKRSSEQESALKKLINDQHNPRSESFHHWLKPAEFGKRFGVADSDLETVKAWLQAKGFTINKVNSAKSIVDISGTAGQLAAAFHTELHTYSRNGQTFIANNKDPEIPKAFAGVVAGFASLNNFKPKSDLKVLGEAKYDPKTHKATPEWSYPAGGGGVYLVPAPADMAVQYNIASVYSSGTTGTGETIGIMSASNVDLSIVQNYRTLFNLGTASNVPQVIVDGDDPGQNGAATEAYLDVEASGAMAPNAAVNLYVGADTNTTSGLEAAIVRAVEDDAADVMSLSYGSCEQSLGSSGNEFFYYVWQQAAAQGQSVFVSAGDGGSAGCDDFDTESAAVDGLAVSGYTSTPYNTSVGGTDFYYSYYYEGGSGTDLNNQLMQYWNLTGSNTPSVSILQTVPEQPWNNSLGLDIGGAPANNIVAGSGGMSSCAYGVDDPDGEYDTCTGGYAKPSWQSAPGVPADGVRDVPDVSLFAANGINYSFWPICTQDTDCLSTYAASGGPVQITGVGGTSASSPATAGIMALIDQSQKGRQGDANYYLYAIATADPSAFNDVTNGSNNVVCEEGTPNCSLDTNGDGYYSLQEYPATAGYDLASGLGTLNVANLIADWSKVSLSATTTTLALSSTSVTHGTPITATATVSGTNASTAGGAVALVTTSPTPAQKGQGTIQITDGTGTGSIILAGGNYSVTGVYSGDGVNGPSDSSPVNVSISPESSSVTLVPYTYLNGNFTLITAGSSVPFGSSYIIDADIAGASGQGAATGTVKFNDGATAIGTAQSNTAGVAELNFSNFTSGSHSITASYSGDPSFSASTSAALTFTVTQGSATIYSQDTYETIGLPAFVGQSFTVPVVVGNLIAGGYVFASTAAPTGTVTITLGTQTQTVPLTNQSGTVYLDGAYGYGGYNGNYGFGSATFTGLTAGNDALTITYSGDANYAAASYSGETIPVVAATLANSSTTITASYVGGQTSVNANGAAQFSIGVTGTISGTPPTGDVILYDNGDPLYEYALDGVTDVVTGFIPAAYLINGANALTVTYLGDGNYNPSTSAAATLNANAGDFSLITSNQNVVLNSSASATATLTAASLQGFSGSVNLTCSTSNAQLTCAFNPASVMLTPDGAQYSSTLSIQAPQSVYPFLAQRHGNSRGILGWVGGSGVALALFVLGFPARHRRNWKTRGGLLMLVLAMIVAGAGLTGCGSSSSNNGSLAPGTYSVNVTANGSGIVHNTTIQVVVN